MKYRIIAIMIALACVLASASYAVEKESSGAKIKNFWQKLFNYPARVTEESATVVTDAGKSTTKVVTTEVKRIGEVTSGDVAKTKELIVEPITGTAETVVEAVEGTVKIPVEAAREESASTENK